MTGYVHPMSDEIAQSLVRVGNPTSATWQEVVDELGDTFGGMLPERPEGDTSGDPFSDDNYPHQHDYEMGEFRQPWAYPTTEVELSPTVVGPAAQNSGPKSIFDEQLPNAVVRDGLECATSPAAADAVGREFVTTTTHMGDSVSFSQYLIWLASRSMLPGHDVDPGDHTHGPLFHGCPPGLVDWNLDSDRGLRLPLLGLEPRAASRGTTRGRSQLPAARIRTSTGSTTRAPGRRSRRRRRRRGTTRARHSVSTGPASPTRGARPSLRA